PYTTLFRSAIRGVEVLAVHVDRGARVGVAGDRDVGAVGAGGAHGGSSFDSDEPSDNQNPPLRATPAPRARPPRPAWVQRQRPRDAMLVRIANRNRRHRGLRAAH